MTALPGARGQQRAGRIWRVGVLTSTGQAGKSDDTSRAFNDVLREFGFVEGRNLVIDFKYSDVRKELLPALAAELILKTAVTRSP